MIHGVGGGVDLHVGGQQHMVADVHLAHVEYGDVEVEEGLLADVDVAAEFAGEGGADPAGVGAVGEEVAADLLAQDVIPRR